MKKYISTNTFRWLLLIVGIGFVIELMMFVNPFSVLFAAIAIYIGIKLRPNFWGTLLLVVGIFTAAGIIFKLKILKIAILILLFLFFYRYYWKSKDNPRVIQVETTMQTEHETYVKKQPFIRNTFIGNQKFGDHVYEIDDINIQTGIGNTLIDLSMTMLPPGETVIVIRGFIGNIQLLVPYDVEASINHSVLVGHVQIFSEEEEGFNKNIIYYPKNYAHASRKVKILTSIVIGDLEVRNI